MPCLLGCAALFFPRIVIIAVWLLSDWLEAAYTTALWPILGFFFLPLTTLAYAAAWHMNPSGSVSGLGVALIVVAVLIDIGMVGGGAHGAKSKK